MVKHIKNQVCSITTICNMEARGCTHHAVRQRGGGVAQVAVPHLQQVAGAGAGLGRGHLVGT